MNKANQATCSPNVLEKAKQIAKEIVSHEVKAVILSGSAARGKENPNDLDFLIIGKLENSGEIEKALRERYEIPVQLCVFSDDYVNSLIKNYRDDKILLRAGLTIMSQETSGRSLSWPLIPLLSEEEFYAFFPCYMEGHPYLTKEYVILEGQDYIEAKRRELNIKKEEATPEKGGGIFRNFKNLFGLKKKERLC